MTNEKDKKSTSAPSSSSNPSPQKPVSLLTGALIRARMTSKQQAIPTDPNVQYYVDAPALSVTQSINDLFVKDAEGNTIYYDGLSGSQRSSCKNQVIHQLTQLYNNEETDRLIAICRKYPYMFYYQHQDKQQSFIKLLVCSGMDIFRAELKKPALYNYLRPTDKHDAEIKTIINDQLTPLLEHNNAFLLDSLLDEHPELIEHVDTAGNTLLHLAATYETDMSTVIQCLIKHKISLNTLNQAGETALDIIIDNDIPGTLLLAQTGALTKGGGTLLHVLLIEGPTERVASIKTVLATPGIAIDTPNAQGQTALTLAIHNGDRDIARLIIPKTTDNDRIANLEAIIANEPYDHELAQIIVAHLSPEVLQQECYVLHTAIKHNRLELIRELLRRGINASVIDTLGQTPLSLAINKEDLALINLIAPQATNEDKITCLRHLAEKDAYPSEIVTTIIEHVSVKTIQKSSNYLLYSAIAHNRLDLVKTLLTRGAKTNINDSLGHTPLRSAIQYNRIGCINLIALRTTDEDRIACLCHIIETEPYNDDMAQAILKHISREALQRSELLHLAVTHGRTVLIDSLVTHGADVNKTDAQGKTALHLATQSGNTDIIEALLNKFADPLKKNQAGEIPLQLAISNNHADAVYALLTFSPSLQMATRDNRGNTPLHQAVNRGNINIVEKLLNKRANPRAVNTAEETPLSLATRSSNQNIQRLFEPYAFVDALIQKRKELEQELKQPVMGFFARHSTRQFNKNHKIEAIDALLRLLNGQPSSKDDNKLSEYATILLEGRTGALIRQYQECWPETFQTAAQPLIDASKAARAALKDAMSK